MSELVAGVVEDTRFEAHAIGKNVVFKNGGEATIRSHAELLHSVEDVVRNALCHTAPATNVMVSVERQEVDGTVHIAVRDYGSGVPEDELAEIFCQFVRSSVSNAMAGHGLGRAIAQQIITTHGGTIKASNADGGGLCVDI